MYSLVLATMLTTGSAAPANFWGHGCYGCQGCWGCHGCYGSCYGCYGGCWGCHGCYGSCYGCYGACYGCYGGCYSSCYGCYGSCYGCYGCYGGCYGCYGVAVVPTVVVASYPTPPPRMTVAAASYTPAPAKFTPMPPADAPPKSEPAKVTLILPEGARLFANDVPVAVSPSARTFETPPLEPGKPYHYVFKAEVMRDGKMETDVKRVQVAAGKQVTVEFKGAAPVAAARR